MYTWRGAEQQRSLNVQAFANQPGVQPTRFVLPQDLAEELMKSTMILYERLQRDLR